MFHEPILGNPAWFRVGRSGPLKSYPVPASRRAYAYLAALAAGTLAPVGLLEVVRGDHLSSAVWLVVAVATLAVESVGMVRAVRRKADADVLYIPDEAQPEVVFTQQYELRPRT